MRGSARIPSERLVLRPPATDNSAAWRVSKQPRTSINLVKSKKVIRQTPFT